MLTQLIFDYFFVGVNFLHRQFDAHPVAIRHVKQDLDPNEVYTEDYEDGVPRNQGIKIDYNSSYLENCPIDTYEDDFIEPYQSQYYNYQGEFFNEEDEYKYLEKEQEEENNLQHLQKHGHQQSHHHKQHHLDELDEHEIDQVGQRALSTISRESEFPRSYEF